MDLRTRYTALVTLTTQHVKYISDALRRLEEEEVCLFSPYIKLVFKIRFFCLIYHKTHFYSNLCSKRWRKRSRPEWDRFLTSWAGSGASREGLGVPTQCLHLLLNRCSINLYIRFMHTSLWRLTFEFAI